MTLTQQQTETDQMFMRRCLQLASKGLGKVQPNPMVGAVITYNGKIIGEGWHQKYGEAHAEVNAIHSVEDKTLLQNATLYINLEPCSHYGKTPPCVEQIMQYNIPKVVIGNEDPNALVKGKGIAQLKRAGITVIENVLEKECCHLNRRFFSYHQKLRPYIILKWAETTNGFMDIKRTNNQPQQYWITNAELKTLVHKWRSEEDAILIGYNTLINDKPQLTTRHFVGKNPIPIIVSRNELKVNNDHFPFIEGKSKIDNILSILYQQGISSVLVEGGRKTLDLFIQSNKWDEARILTGNISWEEGTKAPNFNFSPARQLTINHDLVRFYINPLTK